MTYVLPSYFPFPLRPQLPLRGCGEVPPGSVTDVHGCNPSTGYTWCESLKKCLRTWEENCPAVHQEVPVLAYVLLAGLGLVLVGSLALSFYRASKGIPEPIYLGGWGHDHHHPELSVHL